MHTNKNNAQKAIVEAVQVVDILRHFAEQCGVLLISAATELEAGRLRRDETELMHVQACTVSGFYNLALQVLQKAQNEFEAKEYVSVLSLLKKLINNYWIQESRRIRDKIASQLLLYN